jgi:hypothetical protein
MNPLHLYLIGIDMCDAQESPKPVKHQASSLDKPPVSGIQSTLAYRGKTHGDFAENSRLIQQIKHDLRRMKGWAELSNSQREALDMIVHKIGRIMCGNPNEPDHWKDIAGYATLVENILTTGKSHPTLKGTENLSK